MNDALRLRGPVLVAGATGFIGRHLVAELVTRRLEVVSLSRHPARWSSPLVSHRAADLSCPETLRGVAEGCRAVFHLVSAPSDRIHRDPREAEALYERINVAGTCNLLAEAERAGVGRFLFLSSVKAAAEESRKPLREEDPPRPATPYGRSKLRAEELVRNYAERTGTTSAIVRPPMVYGRGGRGNVLRLARLARTRLPLPFGRVENRRSLIYVENLVDALLRVLERNRGMGRVFYVADGEPVSTPELIRMVAATTGTRGWLLPVPIAALHALGSIGGRIRRLAPVPVIAGDIERLTGSLVVDDSRIRAECGYRPRFTTAEALGRTMP